MLGGRGRSCRRWCCDGEYFFMMSEHNPRIEVVLTQVVRRVEVVMTEGGGGLHTVVAGSHTGAVPWGAISGVPPNLCTASLSADGVCIEFHDLEGRLISRAPFLT